MEKKYIIKLEENEIAYKTVNSNGCPMIRLLHPAPYTEPDLEQVRKEEYVKGYRRALADVREEHVCQTCVYFERDENEEPCVRCPRNFLDQYTPKQERDAEIRVGDEVEFDDGETAIWMRDNPNEDAAYLMFSDGSCGSHKNSEIVRKTGRHFPEIAEALKKMRESE